MKKDKLVIVTYPDPRLKKRCAYIKDITDEIKNLAYNMSEYVIRKNALGMAAPQVGNSINLVVIHQQLLSKKYSFLDKIMINPEIIERSHERIMTNEGCLSVPDKTANVFRCKKVKVKFTSIRGEERTIEAEDMLSIVLQHETDHLKGILFIDRLDVLEQERLFGKGKSSPIDKIIEKVKENNEN